MNMRCLLSLLCLLTLSTGVSFAQVKPPSADERREAEKTWEALIKTKGGREKLHSITSMLTDRSKSDIQLDIFPHFIWHLTYLANGRSLVSIADMSKNLRYYANENGVGGVNGGSFVSAYSYHRLVFLMETKWDKPEPVRVTRIQRGRKAFDVIETRTYGRRIDFIFDPEELLVWEAVLYDEKNTAHTSFLLSDYSLINGIQMPRTWKRLTTFKHDDPSIWNDREPKLRPIRFAFNVDYDPQLFKRPLRAGSRDDWKAKKNKKQ